MILALILAIIAYFALFGLRKGAVSPVAIYALYMLLSVFVPFLLSYSYRLEINGVYPLTDAYGVRAFVILTFAFAVSVLAIEGARFVGAGGERRAVKAARPDERLAVRFALAGIVLALSYCAIAMWRAGGADAFLQMHLQRAVIRDSIINYASMLVWFAFVFSAAAYVFLPRRASLTVQLTVFLSVLVFLGVSLLLGGRDTPLLFLFALAYKHLVRMPLAAKAFTAACLALVFIVGSAAIVEARFEAQQVDEAERGATNVAALAATGLVMADHMALSMVYAEANGHDYGASYAKMLTYFVPRDLWPGKPLFLGQLVRQFFYGDAEGGIPPGLFGEAYIAFGTAFVLFVAGLLGVLLARTEALGRAGLRAGCALRTTVVAVCAPLFAFILVRGGVDVATFRTGIPVFGCLLLYLACRRAMVSAGTAA